jgi:hypothetical protein
VGAKEQSGRTWPSIFWARGTTSQKRVCSLLLQKYDEVAKKLAQVESELERAEERAETGETKVYTVKKVNGFPIPSRQPNSPWPRIHPGWGWEKG